MQFGKGHLHIGMLLGLATFASIPSICHGLLHNVNVHVSGVKNSPGRYEVNLEPLSICYTYVTTIIITLEPDERTTLLGEQATTAVLPDGNVTGSYYNMVERYYRLTGIRSHRIF
jgi:hypothetical protein